MKSSFRLLTLLLCFELMMAPVVPSLSSVAWAEDQESCSKQKGKTWDAQLNQCLTSQEVATVRNAVKACQQVSNSEDQKKCYADNARAALERSGVDKNKNDFTKDNGDATFASTSDIWSARGAANAATIAIPLFFLIKTMNDKKARAGMKCRPASLMLMYSGAAALLSGEVLTYIMHNKKLDKMKDRMQELKSVEGTSGDAKNTQATEIQSEAFELLAQNEDSIADVAKTKKVTYLAATGLFAAGTAMATIETFQLKAAEANYGNDPTGSQAIRDRLTCGTRRANQNETQALIDQDRKKLDEADAKAKEATDKANAEQKSQQVAEKKKSLLKEMNLPKQIASGAVQKALEKITTKKGNGEEPTAADYENLQKNQDELNAIEACEKKEGLWKWNAEVKTCEPVDQEVSLIDIHDILNLRIKKQATSNIAHAANLAETMQLLAEIDSIEFQNYSKTNYLEKEVTNFIKEISIPQFAFQMIKKSIISESYAQTKEEFAKKEVQIEKVELKASSVKPLKGKSAGIIETSISTKYPTLDLIASTSFKAEPEILKNYNSYADNKWNKAIYSPVTRIAVNGLLGGWMGIMSAHMAKQQKTSEARADKLRNMKEEFNYQAGIMNCSEADRKSTAKPYCYCYTSDNQRNPARNTSTICTKLWGTNRTNGTGNSYLASETKSCVDKDYGVDLSCSCRNRKTSDGKNSCLKAGDGLSMTGINTGTFKMLSVGTSAANDLFSGTASAGSIDTAGLANNAAKIKKAADDMAQKTSPESVKVAKDLEKSLLAGTSGITMGGIGSSSSGASLAGMTPAQAAKALEEELKDSTPEVTSAKGYNATGSGEAPAEPQLEFGMTQDQLATQEEQVAEAMKQNLDYGDNDINKGSKTNIFEVLSNRYQRSGMRRLFEGGEKVVPDKPAESDINQ